MSRALNLAQLGSSQQNSAWMEAQNPIYGRPNWNQHQAMMDSLGNEYAQDSFTYTVDLGAINAAATAIGTINIEKNSAFDCALICGGSNTGGAGGVLSTLNGVDIQLIDNGSNRALMQQSVPMANFVGNGDFPFTLPIVRRFMPLTQVTILAHVYGTVNQTDVQISLIGRKVWMDAIPGGASAPLPRFNTWQSGQTGLIYSEDFFMYDFSLAALATATTTSVTVQTERESDFEWLMTTGSSLTGNGAAVDAVGTAVSVNVKDTGSGRYLYSRATPMGLIAGSGLQPLVQPQPRTFLGATPIQVDFTNNSGSEIDNIHFTMIGRKIFQQN
jgi:hypothetical protein